MPNEELAWLGLKHSTITTFQRSAYRAFAATWYELTWNAVAIIETQALVHAGMDAALAENTVNKAIGDLIKSGVEKPTRIPWGGK